MPRKLLIDIELFGPPVAMQRHRSKQAQAYNPQSAVKEEIRRLIKIKIGKDFVLSNEALLIGVDSYFTRPKSHYGTGKNSGTLKPSAPAYHIITPDHDNLVKFYGDAMTGIVYHDDKQIVGSVECGKVWTCDKAKVRIRVYELISK